MYDFSMNLTSDEQILYQGNSVSTTVTRNIGGYIFLMLFSLGLESLLIWSVVTGSGDGANGINGNFILFTIIIMLFFAGGVYGLIYDLFLKKNLVRGKLFCITNKRVLSYDVRKGKLVFGYLENYEKIVINSLQNNIGDIVFSIAEEKVNSNSISDLKTVKDLMLNPDPENMPILQLQSVQNPEEVKQIAEQARNELFATMPTYGPQVNNI